MALLRILLPVGQISPLSPGLATRCPSHAATGGTSGSSCGPGRDRSGEFPFILFLMHISPEKSTASDEIFLIEKNFPCECSHLETVE